MKPKHVALITVIAAAIGFFADAQVHRQAPAFDPHAREVKYENVQDMLRKVVLEAPVARPTHYEIRMDFVGFVKPDGSVEIAPNEMLRARHD